MVPKIDLHNHDWMHLSKTNYLDGAHNRWGIEVFTCLKPLIKTFTTST